MTVKLMTKQHLEFPSLKGGCTGSSESTLSLVKMPHCWKSHVAAQIYYILWAIKIKLYCIAVHDDCFYFSKTVH